MDFNDFQRVLARVESGDDPEAIGDGGRAFGRYQMHPSFYVSWGPSIVQFQQRELSWDEAFALALVNFLAGCMRVNLHATELMVAMAFHLHGQPRWDGWDQGYADRWVKVWNELVVKPADS